MKHVHQGICQREWEEFLARPPEQQSLEVGSILLARWFQRHTNVSIKQVRQGIIVCTPSALLRKLCSSSLHHPFVTANLC